MRFDSMKILYIPDGHRRYADREKCSLAQAYRDGFRALVEEFIHPLFSRGDVDGIAVFLLSNLNLVRRTPSDLKTLLEQGSGLLDDLVARFTPVAHIRSHGSYLHRNIDLP